MGEMGVWAHLHVCEDERDVLALDARTPIERLEVTLELVDAIPRRDDELEDGGAIDEAREPRERLLPRAADADEERVPPRRAVDPRDPADVPHGVFEEHQIHHGVLKKTHCISDIWDKWVRHIWEKWVITAF